MTTGFFNSVEGAWLRLNSNNNDAANRHNSSVTKYQINSFFTRVQYRLFVCGACGEQIQHENLSNHHSEMHSEVPFIIDMYELFEIDEQFQCVCCNAEVLENDFQTHLEQFHSDVLADQINQNITSSYGVAYNQQPIKMLSSNQPAVDLMLNNQPAANLMLNNRPAVDLMLNNQPTVDLMLTNQPIVDYKQNNQSTISLMSGNQPNVDVNLRYYLCKVCTSTNIIESNLKTHRTRKHPNISVGTDKNDHQNQM